MGKNDRGAALISTFHPRQEDREGKGIAAEGSSRVPARRMPGPSENICRTAISRKWSAIMVHGVYLAPRLFLP